jgi:hypothetical protein
VKIFWRVDPLTEDEYRLLEALFSAHHKSAFRDNASSVVVANAAGGSGELSRRPGQQRRFEGPALQERNPFAWGV